jgi:hypothetical protein
LPGRAESEDVALSLSIIYQIDTMEKFLLLIREDLINRENSPEDAHENMRVMTKWMESLAQSGNYLSSDPLRNSGKYVTRDQVVSDGPFIEAKESVSGFFLITAENIEQAASIAQTCPLVLNGQLVIEVRPIMTLNNGRAC